MKTSEGLTGNGSMGEGWVWHAYSRVLRTRFILSEQQSSLARENAYNSIDRVGWRHSCNTTRSFQRSEETRGLDSNRK